MSDEPKIKNARVAAIYYDTQESYCGGRTGYDTVTKAILGTNLKDIAKSHWYEEQNNLEFHLFKLVPISRSEYEKEVKKQIEKENKQYKKERKNKLLKELKELEEI